MYRNKDIYCIATIVERRMSSDTTAIGEISVHDYLIKLIVQKLQSKRLRIYLIQWMKVINVTWRYLIVEDSGGIDLDTRLSSAQVAAIYYRGIGRSD